MSIEDVLNRGMVRGVTIWPVFKFQIPGLTVNQASQRAIIFGIYSGAYVHGYNYLQEISYELLAQMVLTYNQAMAELTAEEQRAVIDITAKRYIEDQVLAAKDAALENDRRKVTVKTAEVDAKFEALESDRQALATKITELEVTKRKTNTIIQDLYARIEEQTLNSAEVEAEITRQQLIQRKAELDVIETGIKALEIQAQVAEAAYRLSLIEVNRMDLQSDIERLELETVEVDVTKAQTQADTARLKNQKENESLIESELEVSRAETSAYTQETAIITEKGVLYDQRIANADVEIAETIPKLSQVIEDEKTADLIAQEAKNDHAIAEYENRTLNYNEKVDTSNALMRLEVANHATEAKYIADNANKREELDHAEVSAHRTRIAGAERATEIISKAKIVNTLTHQIGAAE